MKMGFGRGSSVVIAMGLMLSGGAALAAQSPSAAGGVTFAKGTPSPFAATRFDGATVGKKVYFLGFRAGDDTTDGSVWYYDITTKKYVDTKVDMPVPISNYTIAVLKDKAGDIGLYTFGGRNSAGKIITTVQVYDPATNKATVVKTDPWPGKTPSGCVSLPGTGVTVVNNTAYVMGGMSFSTSVPACTDDNSKQVWSFNPAGANGKKWKAQPNLPLAEGYVSPAVVGGNTIYAIGGDVNAAGTLTAQTSVESLKVGAKKWTAEAKLNEKGGCDETQAFAYDKGPLAGTITVAGCGQWPDAITDVLQYNVKSNKWTKVGTLLEARRNGAGADIGTATAPKMFVLGGYNSDGTVTLMTSEIGTAGKFLGTHQVGTHQSAAKGSASLF